MNTVSPVGDPSYLGAYTFAQMKALTGMANGSAVFVTNYGKGGSIWRYSAALSDWFPAAPLKVYENTAIVSGVAQTAAQILLAIPIEAGLLANKTFRVLATPAKNGGTDTLTPILRMGNAGTTADAAVANYSTLTGANRAAGYETWFRMASVTSVERLGGPVSGSWTGVTSLVGFAAATVATVANASFLTITGSMSGTTDTPQVGYVAVEIQS